MLLRYCVLIAVLAPGRATAQDLVVNGDVEVGGASSALGWQTHVAEGSYEFAISDQAHAGRRCLAIRATDGTTEGWGRWYTADLFMIAGATYRLSLWTRTEGDAAIEVWMPETQPPFMAPLADATDWTRIEADVTVDTTGRYGLYLQSRRGGAVFFDDISLTMTVPPPETPGEDVPTDGAPIRGVVIPEQAGPHHVYAALETQRVLGTMTGRTPPLRVGPAEGRCIWIGLLPPGRSYAAQLALVGDEGIVLDIGPDAIVCLGNTARGVYYAVQELFHTLGCRWSEPGQIGEAMPKVEQLRLAPRLIVHEPSFKLRGAHIIQAYHYPPDWSVKHCEIEPWVDWAARNRMNRLKPSYPSTWDYGAIRGYGVDEVAGHSLHAILPPERWFDTHPEYYPLVGGERTHLHSSGRAAEICVSNPDLPRLFADTICEYFDSHPTALRYCINAEDEPSYWCECDACKALDPVPQDWSKNGVEVLDLTDRWLWFINQVAALVEPRCPDRWIATFAYGSTRELPKRELPRRNVMIELTWWDQCFKHRIEDPACEINRKGLERFHGWSRLAPLALYRYLDYHHNESPGPYFHAEADILRVAHAAGCRFLSDEWDTTFTASPLLLNLRARLEWDIDTDVDAFIDDFCASVYGSAGPTMAAYYRRLERAVVEAPSEDVTFNDLGKFTDAVLREGHALLDEAASLAGDDTVAARIDRQRYALLFTELDQVAEQVSADPALYPRQAELQARLRELIERRGITPIVGYYGRLGGGYVPPVEALAARRVLQLPDTWRFRVDPENAGEGDGWNAVEPDDKWETISILKPWEEQGHPGYDGYAWYSTGVLMPPVDGRRVWLLCEAVDETFRLWIDGQYVGASEGDPGILWDKPVAVDITAFVKPGETQRFTLQVHDSAFAGGLWKPVWIVAE